MTDDVDTLSSEIAATPHGLASAVRALLLDGQSEDEVIDIRDAWDAERLQPERVRQA